MNILKTSNLKKYYGVEPNVVKALDGVDLEIEENTFVAIVGTSGSGKSTLLNMLGGLDIPTSGSVIMDQQELANLSDDELTIFRRRNVGFVFQHFNLVPVLNVYENILLPMELDGKKADEVFVQDVIKTLGLQEKIGKFPSQLSGGQQQRVAIARALVAKPSIILADEPTGNLDSKTSSEVLALLKISSEKYNQTVVMITHSDEVAQMSDRIVRVEDGRIISASPKEA